MFGQSAALFCLQLLLFDFWSKTLKPNSLLSLSKETVLVQVGDSLLNMVKAKNNDVKIHEIHTDKTKNLFDLKEKKVVEKESCWLYDLSSSKEGTKQN